MVNRSLSGWQQVLGGSWWGNVFYTMSDFAGNHSIYTNSETKRIQTPEALEIQVGVALQANTHIDPVSPPHKCEYPSASVNIPDLTKIMVLARLA